MAGAGRPDPRGDGRPGRLPLPARRADAEQEALDILHGRGRAAPSASAELLARGYPAYTTTPGWLGYDDEKLARLSKEAVAEGFSMIKLKVGGNLADDIRRLHDGPGGGRRRACRSPSTPTRSGACPTRSSGWATSRRFDPYWIEEPTSPGRRPRARAHPGGDRADPGGHRRARAQPGHVQAAAAGRRGRRGADRRLPGRRRERERGDPAAGGEVRRARSVRTRAASACARWSSTWRCSTCSRSAAAPTSA